jgi:hypothetical protein
VLPADLGTASLAVGAGKGPGSGLEWLVWALLALLLAAVLGAPALLWSRRRRPLTRPSGESR